MRDLINRGGTIVDGTGAVSGAACRTVEAGDADGWRSWFARVATANAAGARIHPQVANRCFGLLMGHPSRMNPFRRLPTCRALADLPFDARMSWPRTRADGAAGRLRWSMVTWCLAPRDHHPLGGPLDDEPRAASVAMGRSPTGPLGGCAGPSGIARSVQGPAVTMALPCPPAGGPP